VTTPVERMRALRWGYELLGAMQQDQSLPSEYVARATCLADVYPTPQALAQLLERDSCAWPFEYGLAIDQARGLFEDVQHAGLGSPETRRHTLYTLRHFPLQRAKAWVAAAASPDALGAWLAPEDA